MEHPRSSRAPLVWIAIGALLVVCAVSKPDKAAHTAAIKEKAMAEARKSGDVAGIVGMGLMGGFADTLLGGILEYNSFVLFSTTSTEHGTTSFGVLGHVFVGGQNDKPRSRR